jgi:hypothetical protein
MRRVLLAAGRSLLLMVLLVLVVMSVTAGRCSSPTLAFFPSDSRADVWFSCRFDGAYSPLAAPCC